MQQRDGRLGVGVVGSAPIGAVLARGLAGAGHALIGFAIDDTSERERVQAMFPGVPQLDPREVVERSELVILAEDEDALVERIDTLTLSLIHI